MYDPSRGEGVGERGSLSAVLEGVRGKVEKRIPIRHENAGLGLGKEGKGNFC